MIKRSFLLLFILILTGCTEGEISPSLEPISSITTSSSTTTSEIIFPHEIDLNITPITLLGDYYITNTGYLLFTYPYENQVFDLETANKYFFGTWTGKEKGVSDDIIIDEFNNNYAQKNLLSGNIIWVSEHVIAVSFTSGGMGEVWWLDITNPDKLYRINEITNGSVISTYFELGDEKIPEGLSGSIWYQDGDFYDVYTKID